MIKRARRRWLLLRADHAAERGACTAVLECRIDAEADALECHLFTRILNIARLRQKLAPEQISMVGCGGCLILIVLILQLPRHDVLFYGQGVL